MRKHMQRQPCAAHRPQGCRDPFILRRRIAPDVHIMMRSKALVDAILDPLREKYGKPIRVSSGFRNAVLNAAVGGVKTSQHCNGEAADISTGDRDENRKLAKMIVDMGLPFDQLIDENNYAWVHVSYKRNGENRGKMLRYKNKTYYILTKENL